MKLDHVFYNDQGVFFDSAGHGLLSAQRLVNQDAIASSPDVLICWITRKGAVEVRVSAPSRFFEEQA